jgi:hypothetical protein
MRRQGGGEGCGSVQVSLWKKQVQAFSQKVKVVTRPAVVMVFLFPPFSNYPISILTVLNRVPN